MTTPFVASKPSISVSSWFSVCSRSSLPPRLEPPSRFLPIVSISSIKTMQGAFSPACLNRSRTLDAPMPTNISTNSLPAMEKNGTPASPATARASSVLPVPGGPTSSTPLGIFAPISSYFLGLFRKSTISCRLSLASSSPATSLNLMPVSSSTTYCFAPDLPPNSMALPPAPPISCIFLDAQRLTNQNRMIIGRNEISRFSSESQIVGL